MNPKREDVVTLLDEEGTEHNFELVDIITVDDKDYAIMLPLKDAEAEPEEEAVIFRILTGEEDDESYILLVVEDEEEWSLVATAWEERLLEMEEEGNGSFEDEEE